MGMVALAVVPIARSSRRGRWQIRTSKRPVHSVIAILRETRMLRQMSQVDLAEAIGSSQCSVSRWEIGIEAPTMANLIAWANALKLELSLREIR